MKKILILLFCFSLVFFGFKKGVSASGASLFFSPSSGTYALDSNFSVAVKVDSGGQGINAAEGNLNFDKDKLEVVGISKSNSFFSLWTVEPRFSNANGTISFGGGTVRGFSGNSGTICEVSFKAKSVGDAQIIFTSGAVLASDGKGTNVLASIGSSNFIISPQMKAPENDTKADSAGEADKIDNGEKQISEELPIGNLRTEEIKISSYDQNVWHKNNNLALEWDIPEGSSDVSFTLDKLASTDPGKKSKGLVSGQEYKALEDGVWYFHIKFKNGNSWGETSHYQLRVDTNPPMPFSISVEDKGVGEWPILHFKTKDNLSGVVRYEIKIGSLEEKALVLGSDEEKLVASGLEEGKHTAMIKAVDWAGNESYSTQEFFINPIEKPVIINYSKELKSSDQFFVSGTSLKDVKINIFIENADSKLIMKSAEADKNGNWFLISEPGLSNGRYVVWAEAVNQEGIKSEPSAKASFLVSPPVFAKIGSFVVNYFTVFASLLFIIVLTGISILYLAEAIRSRLKKETIEAEDVLHYNLEKLKEEIEKELAELSRYKGAADFTKERIKTKKRIMAKIKVTEGKVMKEVKDVEKILK